MFLPVAALNDMRRELLKRLDAERVKAYPRKIQELVPFLKNKVVLFTKV